ncbi:hypothetical protein ACFL5Z_07885 [Planctomycetota bacterium]
MNKFAVKTALRMPSPFSKEAGAISKALFNANYEKNDLFGFVFIIHIKTSAAKRIALEMSPFAVSQFNNIAMRQYAMAIPMESNEILK